jgi:hypothetical protein
MEKTGMVSNSASVIDCAAQKICNITAAVTSYREPKSDNVPVPNALLMLVYNIE